MKTAVWKIFFVIIVSVFCFENVYAEDKGQCVCDVTKDGKPYQTIPLDKPKTDCVAFSDSINKMEYDCSWVGGDPGGGPGSYGCFCHITDLATGNKTIGAAPFAYNHCGDQSKDNKDYVGCHWEGEKPKTPCGERDDFCDLIGADGCEDWCKEDGLCTWDGGVCKDKTDGTTTPSSTPTAPSGPSSPQTPSFAELNMLSVDSPQKLLGNILKSAMGLIGSITLVMFVYGGLLWMTAAGNSEKEKKSREIILWSGLGVLVILTAWMIVEFVFEAFK